MPIIFNGQTYNSADDMPPDTRQAYDQAMGTLSGQNQGGAAGAPAAGAAGIFGSNPIIINGQAVPGLDNLPPETRQKIEQAMAMLDADHNGIPDFMERNPGLAQMFLSGQAMQHLQNLPPEKRQMLEQLLSNFANRANVPKFGADGMLTPPVSTMGAGMPAPIPEPPMLQNAPQIPMPAQPAPMSPMMTSVVNDPDTGRRRLVLVLVAILVLLVMAGVAAAAVLYFLAAR